MDDLEGQIWKTLEGPIARKTPKGPVGTCVICGDLGAAYLLTGKLMSFPGIPHLRRDLLRLIFLGGEGRSEGRPPRKLLLPRLPPADNEMDLLPSCP